MNKFMCCICHKEFEGYGHNPYPFGSCDEDRCCTVCNLQYVLLAREEGYNRATIMKEVYGIQNYQENRNEDYKA